MSFPTQGESMFPLIKEKCKLEIEQLPPKEQYGLGEVVVVMPKNDLLVAHRIIKRIVDGNKYTFILKGDFNQRADSEQFSAEQIFGRVKKIYYQDYTVDLTHFKHIVLQWVFLVLSISGILAWQKEWLWKPHKKSFAQKLYRKLMG